MIWLGLGLGVLVGFSFGIAAAVVWVWRLMEVEEHPGERDLREMREWLDGLPEVRHDA
jgi:hypothetical protein